MYDARQPDRSLMLEALNRYARETNTPINRIYDAYAKNYKHLENTYLNEHGTRPVTIIRQQGMNAFQLTSTLMGWEAVRLTIGSIDDVTR